MWGFGLRSPAPSRQAPDFNPVIEAWLDALPPPPAKLASRELKQWRFGNYHGLGRNVFVTCLVLRALSLAIALAATATISSIVGGNHGLYYVRDRMIPVLVMCPMVALWNTAEFATVCFLRDKGISPNISVWADGLLFSGVAIATSILLVDVICGVTDFGPLFDSAAAEISGVCLLIALMIIHSFLLFFFLCNYIDKNSRRMAAGFSREDQLLTSLRLGPKPPAYHAEPFGNPERPRLGKTVTSLHFTEFDPTPPHLAPNNNAGMDPGYCIRKAGADTGPVMSLGLGN